MGISIGIINSANVEVVMNKLAHAAKQLREVKKPITSSISEIGHSIINNAEVMLVWHQMSQLEQLLMVQDLAKAQNETGFALSCPEAQIWIQVILRGIVRQGYSGIIPIECKQLITKATTAKERLLTDWWKLTYFDYDQEGNRLLATVHTILDARIELVYTIVGLERRVNCSIIVPDVAYHWVKIWMQPSNSSREIIPEDLSQCLVQEGQGYICERVYHRREDPCLESKLNQPSECHFRVYPDTNINTTVYVIDDHCACISTGCPYMILNHWLRVNISQYNRTFCVCHAMHIQGCGIDIPIPCSYNLTLVENFTLYEGHVNSYWDGFIYPETVATA